MERLARLKECMRDATGSAWYSCAFKFLLVMAIDLKERRPVGYSVGKLGLIIAEHTRGNFYRSILEVLVFKPLVIQDLRASG